jgi:hypothetical protein
MFGGLGGGTPMDALGPAMAGLGPSIPAMASQFSDKPVEAPDRTAENFTDAKQGPKTDNDSEQVHDEDSDDRKSHPTDVSRTASIQGALGQPRGRNHLLTALPRLRPPRGLGTSVDRTMNHRPVARNQVAYLVCCGGVQSVDSVDCVDSGNPAAKFRQSVRRGPSYGGRATRW